MKAKKVLFYEMHGKHFDSAKEAYAYHARFEFMQIVKEKSPEYFPGMGDKMMEDLADFFINNKEAVLKLISPKKRDCSKKDGGNANN